MGRIERWAPLWEPLTSRWRVTAMDRRGRGSSGDTEPHALRREFEDVAAVAAAMAGADPVDVFGHSYGAVCALGAAAQGAVVRRLALYEPPGPPTVPAQWRARALSMIEAGQPGRAMFSFLTEIIGLTAGQVDALPAWAHEIIRGLDAALTNQTLAVLDGQGHDAIDAAPELLVTQLAAFFS